MRNLQNHFTGTYAQHLLADWPILSAYLRTHTTWVKDTLNALNDAENDTLPTQQQINDALNGPYHTFFKSHWRAYIKIATLKTAITAQKEDFFKESAHLVEKIFALPPHLLAKTDFSLLAETRAALDTLTITHNEQWFSSVQNWTNALLTELKKMAVPLSDSELHDFTVNEPLSELVDRFIHLKITPPQLSRDGIDFQQYFKLKLMLAIHSALHRSQLPSSANDLDAYLKKMQLTLNTIHQQEKALSTAQEDALNQLVKAFD